MKNKLELFDTERIAIFTGETGSGKHVVEEEAHNIQGDNEEDRIQNALIVWGADVEETNVIIS